MKNNYEIRTKDGMSHFFQKFSTFIRFFFNNLGNMYYIRIDF